MYVEVTWFAQGRWEDFPVFVSSLPDGRRIAGELELQFVRCQQPADPDGGVQDRAAPRHPAGC